ncbi:hypothetical protein RRG08_022013 [Elysia crispata]|uniref:C-type lectin domain-containing protein n=1 Tax=Elysia crispata TaxID=231223 RepID=A0AAE1DUC7_9GAST|nr:hypothetical protein RRG08_022013 [Elysia crispata]
MFAIGIPYKLLIIRLNRFDLKTFKVGSIPEIIECRAKRIRGSFGFGSSMKFDCKERRLQWTSNIGCLLVIKDKGRMAWKYLGLALVLAVFIEPSIKTASGQTVLLDLNDKTFFITDTYFVYSNFSSACQASGLDVGIIDTNAQYLLLQAAVINTLASVDYEIWVYLEMVLTKAYTYWWTDEEVNATLWWPEEPNLIGRLPPLTTNYNCSGPSLTCRPIQMRGQYPKMESLLGPLLMDTCCLREAQGLCMQGDVRRWKVSRIH